MAIVTRSSAAHNISDSLKFKKTLKPIINFNAGTVKLAPLFSDISTLKLSIRVFVYGTQGGQGARKQRSLKAIKRCD